LGLAFGVQVKANGLKRPRLARLTGQPVSPPLQGDITGHIDGVDQGVVLGWAARRSNPGERLTVEVLVDGVAVAQDLASRFREDLSAAGWGDGRHAFEVCLPDEVLDGQVHRLEVVEKQSRTSLFSTTRERRLDIELEDQNDCLDLLFDAGFYQAQSGIRRHGLDHYRRVGWKSGLDPHPLFSTRHYLAAWPAAAQTDPLSHFEAVGQYSRTTTHPLFDVELFLTARPLKSKADRHPVLAYLMLEPAERPGVSRYFSDAQYTTQVDLAGTEFSPLLHYLRFGHLEGRRPASGFDPKLFRKLVGLSEAVEPFTWFVQTLQTGAGPRPDAANPSVSVVILNHNNALLTLQCFYHLRRHTDAASTEIIVVDNGSRSEDFDLLCRHAGAATVVRVDCNRGFGEGCNIGVEHARGEFLLFLNNDAFLTAGCMEALKAPLLRDPAIAATGPKLLFADGGLQEAGAFISACGTAVQRGRGLHAMLPAFNIPGRVDYCSAAALLVRTSSFHDVLGFDHCWDPAYYEDSDLCLKLNEQGGRTEYVPSATVVHLEHVTAADKALDLKLDNIIEVNRLKFVSRWSTRISGSAPPDVLAEGPDDGPPRAAPSARLGLYTPYPLVPGGGERYLLTLGAMLGDQYRATLQTPDRYSRLRLLSVGRALGLDLRAMGVETHADGFLHAPYDLFVCMGNYLFPPVPGYGARCFYHCQFPFPMTPEQSLLNRRNLATYDGVIVNSEFTAQAVCQLSIQAGLQPPSIHVLPPPAPQIQPCRPQDRGSPVILSVGRFAPGGHCKRQDVMIEAFRRLSLHNPSLGAELHLAGSLAADLPARNYLRDLMQAAGDLRVYFHIDPTADQLKALYRRARLYWHLTGAGADLVLHPERAEHFGIAIVEAMSAGVAPVALRAGGPAEIISNGRDGFLIDTPAELVERTQTLLRDPALLVEVGQRAVLRARDFSEASFAHRLQTILQGCATSEPNLAAVG
jgi:GT2 family glycosyltransferase/glycosyltransferase involved in cell wall biosynthesis